MDRCSVLKAQYVNATDVLMAGDGCKFLQSYESRMKKMNFSKRISSAASHV